MVARGIVLGMMLVCLCGVLRAQAVDLTKPLPADGQTILLYHLDDVATGQVKDAVAGGKTGVVKDALSTLGRFDGAMTCNGVKGWIDVNDLPSVENLREMTVECWVKFYGEPGGDILVRNSGYMLRVGGTLTAYFGIDGGWKTVTGGKALTANKWTHLAMTYDQATKKVSIYVDGELDVSEVPKGVTAGKLNPGDSLLRIGGRTWRETEGILNGAMDELRVSSVVRTYEPLYRSEEKPVPANTNLVGNPGFESGLHGWFVNGEVNTNLLWKVETGNAPQGRSYARATQERARVLMSYPFRIQRGAVVTVSALMRGEKTCKGSLALRSTGGGSGVTEARRSNTVQVGTEWKRVSSRFTVGTDWPTDLVYAEVGPGENVKVDVDAVSVVVGNGTEYTQTEGQSIGIAAGLPKQSTYMLKSGSKMPVEVVNAGEREQRFGVTCLIKDWQGKTVKESKIPVTSLGVNKTLSSVIDIPDDRVGWFEAKFVVSLGDQILKETSRIYNVIEPMKGVGEATGSLLGMNTHMEREPNEHLDCNLGMLSLCGVKRIRGWWGWGMVEKEPGKFDWTEYDRQYDAVKRAGMEIMPIFLRYYPQWEHAWSGPVDKIERYPNSLEQWGSYVKTTAARYRGKVKYWEVWNEPHLAEEAKDGKLYGALLKTTYENVKAADPNALVVGGGGVVPDYIRVLCEVGFGKYMDVISYHSYGQLGRPFTELEIMAEEDNRIREKFGTPKRVWHTEQGTKADGMGYLAAGQSEKDCAVNLSQAYLGAGASGVEKFFWFSAQTSVRYGWAVFYESYIPRPRLIALNGLARVLKDRKVTGRMVLGSGKVACVPMDGKGGAAAALWNTDEMVTVTLPAGTEVTALDMLANPVEKPAKAGEMVLTRGEPVFVVAKKGTLKELTDALSKAKVDDSIPVTVADVRVRDTGKTGLAIANDGDRNIDLRLTVEGAGMTKETIPVNDLGPGLVYIYYPQFAKSPAAGTEATLKVMLEAGGYLTREETREVKVRF